MSPLVSMAIAIGCIVLYGLTAATIQRWVDRRRERRGQR